MKITSPLTILNPSWMLLAALSLFGAAQDSYGVTFNDWKVESWTGSGPNTAMLLVDFSRGTDASDSFAFGVRFSSANMTGYDLLHAVDAGNANFVATTSVHPQYGEYLLSIEYLDPKTNIDHIAPAEGSSDSMSYWTIANKGLTWTPSDIGASTRVVSNGDVDAWMPDSWVTDGTNYWLDTTYPPVTPLPEPSTIVLAMTAGLAFWGWRKKSRA
jgi:hypothetical protein